MSFVSSIGLAVPENRFEQSVISSFMEALTSDEEQRRKIRTVFRASGIKTRHSVLADYGRQSSFDFFPNTHGLEPFPQTSQRMQVYQQQAIALSVQAVQDAFQTTPLPTDSITHLITVSCTGMYAPGLDIDLIKQLGLKSSVNRTSINFMGCFAAITALKSAYAICQADSNAKVLIVCTELCSLHFQKNFTDDNILANALFADGAAALLVTADSQHALLSIENFHSDIAHQGAEAMAWSIGDFGFEMRLSSYVPNIVGKGIQALVAGLIARHTHETMHHFAIHPGGKKILEEVGNALTLPKEKLEPAYDVLMNYGNMSSPSIVFVLKKLLTMGSVKSGENIIGMAFGPGLTMESFLMKRV
jgi:alpha-pyrone synthase